MMPNLPFENPAPRARVLHCPLNGTRRLQIRCAGKYIDVRGGIDLEHMAKQINSQLEKVRRLNHPGVVS